MEAFPVLIWSWSDEWKKTCRDHLLRSTQATSTQRVELVLLWRWRRSAASWLPYSPRASPARAQTTLHSSGLVWMSRQMPAGDRNRNQRSLGLIDTCFVALFVGVAAEELRTRRAFLNCARGRKAAVAPSLLFLAVFSPKDLMLRLGKYPCGAASNSPRWVISEQILYEGSGVKGEQSADGGAAMLLQS